MHRDVVSWVSVTRCGPLDAILLFGPRMVDIFGPLRTDFVLTASVDGHLKFWKKKDPSSTSTDSATTGVGIEFVKHYRAHLSPVLALSVSADGLLAATVAADGAQHGGASDQIGSVKVFDVENFGLPATFVFAVGL